MKNYLVAKIFYEIADMLEMQEDGFRPNAYRKVARIIETVPEDIEELYKKGELAKLPGVGVHLRGRIEEIIQSGKLGYHEELRKQIPVDLEDLMSIEGMGPKMIKRLYDDLGIKTIKDLEKAAKSGKIRGLPHFGEKSEQKILMGIKFFKRSEGRFLLGLVSPIVNEIISRLEKLSSRIEVAGSIRRKKETIGDIDILVATKQAKKIMEIFVGMPEVETVLAKGDTKSLVRLNNGINADIRVIKEESFGSALQYFTGSKEHNVELRKLALANKLKLNEYGVFKKTDKDTLRKIAGKDEEEVYKALGLPCIEPELREARGEIEAAINNSLPNLIGYNDLKGDLHDHTTWSEGSASIKEMAEAGLKMGYNYMAITDHAGRLRIANAMDDEKLLRQIKEIDRINQELKELYKGKKSITLLKGAEVDINKDGTLDISDEVLKQLDIVVGSVHSDFKMPKEEMTKRIMKAMRNPYMKVLGHPTGRIIRRREGYEFDLEKILDLAQERKIALEVNSWPERLDLRDEYIREAIKKGVKIAISSDSHALNHLFLIEFGISNARRGWAEKKNVLNTMPLEQLLEWFNNRKSN